MRQYRREAVKCEAKMFERRREKYSNLLLQVMSVMDRVQVRRLYGMFYEAFSESSLKHYLYHKVAKSIGTPCGWDTVKCIKKLRILKIITVNLKHNQCILF